ncbi:hypothetical protein K438DRAFT_1872964 [Mycena galopus ATCC 62051]|nr:hypothetical protein K438DRAFT_1872964 [Mycena galopus ATCC 62051]
MQSGTQRHPFTFLPSRCRRSRASSCSPTLHLVCSHILRVAVDKAAGYRLITATGTRAGGDVPFVYDVLCVIFPPPCSSIRLVPSPCFLVPQANLVFALTSQRRPRVTHASSVASRTAAATTVIWSAGTASPRIVGRGRLCDIAFVPAKVRGTGVQGEMKRMRMICAALRMRAGVSLRRRDSAHPHPPAGFLGARAAHAHDR